MILFPIKKGVVTQKFGENVDFYQQNFKTNGHNGIDIVSFHGDKILAPEDGVAFKVLDLTHGSVTKGFGVHILGRPDQDGFCNEWILWHTTSDIQVKQGDRVHQGDCVAFEGDSGQVYVKGVAVPDSEKGVEPFPGTHLHWGKRIVKRVQEPPLNTCLSDINGGQYKDADGFFYEIQNYDNGFNGCLDPMKEDVWYYDQWISQLVNTGVEAAIVGTTLSDELPEPEKTTLLQAILNVLKKVGEFFKLK